MGELLKRLFAFAAAGLMILGALQLRNRINDDQPDSGDRTDGKTTLLCVPEAETACRAAAEDDVTIVIEDPGKSAARLGAERSVRAADVDTWVAPDAWIAIMQDTRTRNNLPPLFEAPRPVAQSSLVVVGATSRLQVITSACKGTLRWRCLGDIAVAGEWRAVGGDATWGRVKLALPGPDASEAPTFLGIATGDLLGRTDFDTLDLDDPASNFGAWLAALSTRKEADAGQAAVQRQLVTGSASLDLVVAMQHQVQAELSGAANSKALAVRTPTPAVTVILAVAGVKNADAIDRKQLQEGLMKEGWRNTSTAPTPLEAPTVLGALIERWRQETT